MKLETRLSALAVCLLVAAAAGCASKGAAKAPPPKPGAASRGAPGATTAGSQAPAPATPEAKPAETAAAPAAASEEAPAAAKAEPAAAKPAPAATPASREPSRSASSAPGGSFDDFMKRTGKSIEETKFLGMRLRPYISEEIGFTDNVYYQDENERFVVNPDPDGGDANGDGVNNAFANDGVDNDADGLVDEAGESLAEPRGEVSEIFSNLNVGMGFELPLNSVLLSVIGENGQSLEVLKLDMNYIEYFKESDSPDAFNFNGHVDIPLLLKLTKDFNRSTFYFRAEADYAQVTDPLDVATYQFSSVNPTLDTVSARSDFQRTEIWGKATAGWQGPKMDAELSGRLYQMTLDDDDLQSADHTEAELYAEVGYGQRDSEKRFYIFGELTIFDFDERDSSTTLRDFDKTRLGGGWEGPLFTRKLRANFELFAANQEIDNVDDGPFLRNSQGQARDFDEYSGPGGLARLNYRPFVTKATEFQLEYSKDFDWSVVAEHKKVDQGFISLSHPINERLSTQIRYSATYENVSHRERRLYQEAGLRLSYKIAAYSQLFFQYTLRHMDSQDEQIATFADAVNEPFLVRADGDFIANIFSVGISIRF